MTIGFKGPIILSCKSKTGEWKKLGVVFSISFDDSPKKDDNDFNAVDLAEMYLGIVEAEKILKTNR